MICVMGLNQSIMALKSKGTFFIVQVEHTAKPSTEYSRKEKNPTQSPFWAQPVWPSRTKKRPTHFTCYRSRVTNQPARSLQLINWRTGRWHRPRYRQRQVMENICSLFSLFIPFHGWRFNRIRLGLDLNSTFRRNSSTIGSILYFLENSASQG